MHFARVLGTLWATRKYEDLEGAALQIVQPLDADGKPVGGPITAVDTVGAGEGELVFYVTAREAVIAWHKPMVPIDAALVGIVESLDIEAEVGTGGGAP